MGDINIFLVTIALQFATKILLFP